MKFKNLPKDKKDKAREVFDKNALPDDQDVLVWEDGAVTTQILLEPELAETLDENRHTGQRRLNRDRVGAMSNTVEHIGWAITGDSIKLNCEMVLLDGRNRCHTVIKTNLPMPTLVTMFLDDEVMRVIDTQGSTKLRTLKESANADSRSEEDSAPKHQTLLRGLYWLRGLTTDQPRTVTYAILNYDIDAQFRSAIGGLQDLRDAYTGALYAPTWAVFHYMHDIDPGVVRGTLEQLVKKTYRRGSAASALARYYETLSALVRSQPHSQGWGGEKMKRLQTLATFRALRADIEGNSILAVDGELDAGECVHEDEAVIWAADQLRRIRRHAA